MNSTMTDRTPRAGEFYRHFKNKMYQIVGVAIHSETKEKLVIYQALYDDFAIYARPLEMFVSEVDHVKYPQVTQKYRFEKVEMAAKEESVARVVESSEKVQQRDEIPPQEKVQQQTDVSLSTNNDEEMQVNPKLLEFLDAETFDEKYNVLVSMWDDINDKLIDDIAVVMDVIIEDGDLMKRYDDLKFAIRTRQRYEYSNRLR